MYKRYSLRWMKHLDFIVIDLLTLHASFILAYMIRHGNSLPYGKPEYLQLSYVLTLLDLCVIFLYDAYNKVLARSIVMEIKSTAKQVTSVLICMLVYLFLLKQSEIYSRESLIMLWGIWCVISFLARIGWKRILQYHRKLRKQYTNRSVLLITETAHMDEIIHNLNQNWYQDFEISGITTVDDDLTGKSMDGIPIVASRDTMESYIRNHVVDEVFIALSKNVSLDNKVLSDLLNAGITIHTNIIKTDKIHTDQIVEDFGGYTVLTSCLHMVSRSQLVYKRILDLCGAFAGITITGLLTLVIAPVIWIQSPGPVFFSQTRVGKGGRKFKIYKFRSMYPDAEARKQELLEKNKVSDGMMFKLEHDPRIYPFGHFIRKYSLDEFPQFFNVLKGDMSLVGTRPPTVDEYEKYELHHKSRLAAKPGITGMWQVSGRSKIVSFEEVVRLDNEYIQNWSFLLDLKILFKTVKIVLMGDGAM